MQRFIGLMSGTSMDGIDAALLRFDTTGKATLEGSVGISMPQALRERLWQLAHADQVRFADLAWAEEAFCQCQAKAVQRLLQQHGLKPADINAIGSHGQTIEHAPYGHQPGSPPYTLQLDNPSRLAELTGCAVVADFRRRDLAAGGRQPPWHRSSISRYFATPIAGGWYLTLAVSPTLTLLPPTSDPRAPLGFDTGPANALLDAWHERHRGTPFDANGKWANGGEVDSALLERWLAEPYFHRPPPRSTGRELFSLDWAEAALSGEETPRDVQATLAELTATSVTLGIEMAREHFDAPASFDLVPCGGGSHNLDLLTRLARQLPEATLLDSESLGWPADWLEAAAFAWLAHARLNLRPGNLPSVTGASAERVLGGLYAR